MVRTPCCDQNGVRKGTWTPDEDKKLIAYVTRYGCWNWRQLPKFAGLARCGKSCRLRWMNHLRPDIRRGNYTLQEDDTIVKLHHKLGSRWSKIAACLPGRSDNEIKNHWHTNLKKRVQGKYETGRAFNKSKDQVSAESRQEISDSSVTSINTITAPSSSQCDSVAGDQSQISSTFQVPDSFITDTDAFISVSNENLVGEDCYNLAVPDAFVETLSENFWTEPYIVDVSCVPNEEAFLPLSPEYEYDVHLRGHNGLYDEYIGLF